MKEYTIILEIPGMVEGSIYWDTPKGYWEAFQEIYQPIKIECDEKNFREELLLYLNNLHKYGDNWILRVEYNTDTSTHPLSQSDTGMILSDTPKK